jgi:DNA-binding transcriptional LysR family regulator
MAATNEMSAFARIIDLGSFARAAEDLRVTPSALSKLVSRLEDRLGVRLINRTTRRLALTAEGEIYLARARDVLALVESAEAEVSASRKAPKGHLRINTGTAMANRISEQAIPEFLARYPEISIELTVADRIIDPVAENVDVVLRTGELADSALVARKLTDLHRIICAAPAYLERHGTPKTPAELLVHNCLTLSSQARFNAWPFSTGDGVNRLHVTGNFSSDNVGILLRMALQGQGIIRLANFVLGRSIREGLLVALLPDVHMSEPVPLWALMPPGRHRAPRVQAFVEFMAERLKAE